MNLYIKNLTKHYPGGKLALNNLNLELENGILGLLGPNGAGKSTLMQILATITLPTQGKILWEGVDVLGNPDMLRKDLGYLPQDFGVYPNLSAFEFLEYIAALKGIPGRNLRSRIDSLLEEVNLLSVRNKPIRTLSGGMRQRIGIAQVLLNNPKLIIMDEPTVGLDPEERVRFRNLLTDLSGNRIIILSSHIISDIETIASHIAIMESGNLLKLDYPQELLQILNKKVFEANLSQDQLGSFSQSYKVIHSLRQREGFRVRYINESGLTAHPTEVPVKATIEDVYLANVKGNSAKHKSAKDITYA